MASKTNISKSHDRRIIDTLYRVNRILSEIPDLHRLLNLIMEESKSVMQADASSLMLFDKVTDELFFEIVLGDKGDLIKNIRLPLGHGIAGIAARERKPIVVNDVTKDIRHFKKADEISHFETRNIIAVPMLRQGRLIGVIEVLNKTKTARNGFTKEDVKIMNYLADQAAIAIENAQLIRANVASEKLAAVGQAVAGISHYVKNILAGSSGSTQLIEKALKTNDFDLIKTVWPLLNNSNHKITNLVSEMLTYSKERKPNLCLGNINDILDEIYKSYDTTSRDNQIDFQTELDLNLPISMFDGDALHDALLNLVNNALDACKKIPQAKVVISSKYLKKNGLIEIRVMDNGIGIPENIQTKIFEPFFSTKGNKGTGLGLAITRKIIIEHGGIIQLYSKENEGCTFTIRLPYIKPTIEKKS